MSANIQILFSKPLRRVEVRSVERSLPESEVEALVAAAREEASAKVRDQYQAQINDLRTEAVAFHQQLLGHLQESAEGWMQAWEESIPQLVFAGVRAVLAEFKPSDEELHAWLQGALKEAGAGEKGRLEINLNAENCARLQDYWEENNLSLPRNCELRVDEHCGALDCRVVGQKGIVDASLPVRLSQLARLWRVSQ